ncbi:hypothetical protein ACV34H_34300, partial [Pseudomonas aeruginosa]
TIRIIQVKTHRHHPAEKRRSRIGAIYYWLLAKKGTPRCCGVFAWRWNRFPCRMVGGAGAARAL